MKNRQSRAFSSVLINIVAAGMAIGTLTLVGISSARMSHSSNLSMLSASNEDRARAMLERMGIGAEALTAAGLTPQQVATVAQHAIDHVIDHGSALEELINSLAALKRECAEREGRIRSGHPLVDDVSSLQAARGTRSEVESDLETAHAAAFAAATDGLSNGTVSKLTTIISNREWKLPTQYRVLTKTESEWVQFRTAYLEIQSATRRGVQASEQSRDLLQSADSDSDVVAAKSAMDTNCANALTAWQSVLTP